MDEVNCKTCRWYLPDAKIEMRSAFWQDHCDPPGGYIATTVKAVLGIPNENREVKAYFECRRYEMKA